MHLKKYVVLGDNANTISDEALYHRFVQENLSKKYYDTSSQKAWDLNCEVTHRPDLYHDVKK